MYTDGLALALAECISVGLRRKKACEAYNEISSDGLESVAFNDLLLSSEWKVEDEWTWQTPSHINIHETASSFRLLKTEAIYRPRQRFPVGVDSHVALSALAKGRSPSYGLRPVLRRSASVCIAGCLYPAYLFAPTRFNPSDCPTRNVDVPAPSRHGFVASLDFQSLLKLASASGLRRHLAKLGSTFPDLAGWTSTLVVMERLCPFWPLRQNHLSFSCRLVPWIRQDVGISWRRPYLDLVPLCLVFRASVLLAFWIFSVFGLSVRCWLSL